MMSRLLFSKLCFRYIACSTLFLRPYSESKLE